MLSPSRFVPNARLLDFMRETGQPNLINLAAGLPSVDCVPKVALQRAFASAFAEEAGQDGDRERDGQTWWCAFDVFGMGEELTCPHEQGRLRFGLSCDVGFCVGKHVFDIRFFCERDNGFEVFVEVF